MNHVQSAIATAERASGLGTWQYAIVADVDSSRYDLLVECADSPESDARLHGFITAFDAALAACNIEYRSKRPGADREMARALQHAKTALVAGPSAAGAGGHQSGERWKT